MQLIIAIVTRTPAWVFLLFGYFVWQGLQSLRPRTLPLWRLLIVPLVFIGMGLSGMILGHKADPLPVLSWLLAMLLFLPLAFVTDFHLIAIDRGRVTRAGSPIPLVRNVTVFLLHYAIAVATVLHVDASAAMVILGHAVSGATAGYFFGWAMVLLRLYHSAGRTLISEAVSLRCLDCPVKSNTRSSETA